MNHKYTAVANFKFNAADDQAAEVVAGTVERMIEALVQNDIMVGVEITEGKAPLQEKITIAGKFDLARKIANALFPPSDTYGDTLKKRRVIEDILMEEL